MLIQAKAKFQVGHRAVGDFIEYLNVVDNDEIGCVMDQYEHWSRESLLFDSIGRCIVTIADDYEDMFHYLEGYDWALRPSLVKSRWWKDVIENDYDIRESSNPRWVAKTEKLYSQFCIEQASAAARILFNDRATLHFYHSKLAEYNREGRSLVERVTIPSWVKTAVWHRDRGICKLCGKPVHAYDSESHFDHMIAIAEGGVNDITNLQLCCGKCNRQKSKKFKATKVEKLLW